MDKNRNIARRAEMVSDAVGALCREFVRCRDVLELYENTGEDINELIADGYPFAKSFYDIDVDEWQRSTKKAVCKKVSLLNKKGGVCDGE